MIHADPLAEAAVAPVARGMVVGLGTGRAAARAIGALAGKARRESMYLRCVATSEASARLARSLGLEVIVAAGVTRIDYLFDGADEVDRVLRMIKGRGGAMTREKILARAAVRRVYLVQREKVVEHLGTSAPLPIEILPFGRAATIAALEELGLRGPVRRSADGGEYATDNGNPVVDAALPRGCDVESLRGAIDDLPGVVGHGLFLGEADEVIVEEGDRGAVTRMTRGAGDPPRDSLPSSRA
jgi:ribose 5-phosphate isomerase A